MHIRLQLQIEHNHGASADGVLSDLCDGTYYKNHPLFSRVRNALQIVLYYDDIEVCNPLGSSKKIHKLGKCIF